MNPISTLPKEVLSLLVARNPTINQAMTKLVQLLPSIVPPCFYAGQDGGPKGYHLCNHPDEPLGMWVCKCNGCGSKSTCSGYEPVNLHGKVNKRHLIYHVLPVSNGVWQKGVDQLKKRWSLFNGRKIISVMSGSPVMEQVDGNEGILAPPKLIPLDPIKMVKDYLPKGCEVVESINDSTKWELSSWSVLWDSVLNSIDPTDAVLYAHAKGVTRRANSPCHPWAELMYTLALDYWDLIQEKLTKYPIVGSLIKWGRFFRPPLTASAWHYHGNFFWARAGDIKQRLSAVPIPNDRWASEAWAGIAYRPHEAGEIFGPSNRSVFLYNPSQLRQVLIEYAAWLKNNKLSLITV